jgi:hypothetical protein
MPVDIPRTIDVLKTALLRDLGDEVDLIFRYGSHLKKATHRYSDLDISYVPAHDSTGHSITVMVDDVMCDLYPIHWPTLERMASFQNVSSTVLLNCEIVYQRNAAVAARFAALPARLRSQLQREAQPAMVRQALELFQSTGYPYYLLRQSAVNGHLLACLQQAERIRGTILHCLAVCNQIPADTRKLPQVLALPKLPAGFAGTIERLNNAREPAEILAACETLLRTTRELLLSEQRQIHRTATWPDMFNAAYPELKADLQHILLACECRQLDNFAAISLLHELMIHMAPVLTGVDYAGFNTIAEYEQDMAALGFPELLPCVLARDYDGLHRRCLAFDQRLREFLTERSVALNAFATVEELQQHLGMGRE